MSPPESSPSPPLHPGQLRHAWLARVEFAENTVFEYDDEKLAYRVDHETEVVFPEDDAEDDNWAVLMLKGTIGWVAVEGGDSEPPFNLSISVAGYFSWERTGSGREARQAWLEFNGIYLLWPYLRSYVALITGASSLPPLTIYTIRVPDQPPMPSEQVPERASTRAARGTSAQRKPAQRRPPKS